MSALKLAQSMVQHQTLSDEERASLIPVLITFRTHSSVACRTVMYETLITAYNNLL